MHDEQQEVGANLSKHRHAFFLHVFKRLALNKHYYAFLTLTFLTLVNSLYDYNLDSFTKIQSHTLLEMSLFAAELSHI